MANRYWVGGTGTWDSTNTTNWSATSGGAGGASVPTSADAVFFDNNSGPGGGAMSTITISSGTCASLSLNTASSTWPFTLTGSVTVAGNFTTTGTGTSNILGPLTITFTPTANATFSVGANTTCRVLTVIFNGNVTYTISYAGGINVTAPGFAYVVNAGTISGTFPGPTGLTALSVAGGTVTTSGTNFGNVTVSSGSLTMSAALTCTNMTLSGGTLNKATYTLTCSASLNCAGTAARSIAGTSSGAITVLSGAGTIFSCSDATNLTLTNPQTLSVTNTGASAKSLSGPTVGDTASNTFSIDIAGTAANTFNIAGAFLNLTINGTTAKTLSNQTRKIYGDWSSSVGGLTHAAGTAATTFAATTTGRSLNIGSIATTIDFPLIFDGVGGEWTLSWGNTVSSPSFSDFTVVNGTLTFLNRAIIIRSLISSNSNTRTIVLPSSSTLTLTGTTPVDFTDGTNLTLTPGTGTLACSNATATFNGGGKTFATVNFTSTALSAINITGSNTLALVTTGRSASGIGVLTLFADQNVSGGTTLRGGTQADRRLRVTSDTLGTTRTLNFSLGGSRIAEYVDFQDIAVTGPTFSSATNLGNLGGNSGITFTAAKTVYWNNTAGGSFFSGNWAPTSGGTIGVANLPLAQDTAIIENTGLTAGNSIAIDQANYALPTINSSSRTTAWTLSGSVNSNIYGSLTLNSQATFSYSGTLTFQGRGGAQTITSNGVSLASIGGIVVENIGGLVELGSALTMTGDPLTVRRGQFLQSLNLTCGSVTVESTATNYTGFSLTTVSCTNWTFPTTGPTLTLNAPNHTLQFFGSFTGGGKSYRTVTPGDLDTAFLDSNTMETLSRPAIDGATVTFTAGTTQTITNSFMSGGTPSGTRCFLRSSSPGTRYNLSKSSGTVDVVSLDIQDSNATGGAVWNAPTSQNNVDSGNNLGWIFAAVAAFLMLFF